MNDFIMNFHLFDDDGRGTSPLNVNWTGQTGAGQDLSPEMKTFYDRALLKCAEPNLIHDQFGQKRPIPKGSGKTIEFRKFSSLPKALTPLTEGVTPIGQKYSVTAITATVQQYGAYIAVSDMLQLTAFDNNMAEITRILGSQAGRTSDTITREVLAAGTNVFYIGTSADEPSDIGANDVLTVDAIKKAVTFLKRNNATPIQGGDFVAIVHPDTVYDLWNDQKWEEASKYAGSTQIFNGEVGRLYGCRFVETTEAKIWPANDAHGNTVDDYGTLVLAADAFGVTSINNGGIETITKQLGSGGTADPLNQRATIGWKLNKVAKILANEFMVRIEHTTKFASPIEEEGGSSGGSSSSSS